MIFKLRTAGGTYPPGKQVDELRKLGFTFIGSHHRMLSMTKTNTLTIEINTLEELVGFAKTHEAIILNGETETITIYDDYIE